MRLVELLCVGQEVSSHGHVLRPDLFLDKPTQARFEGFFCRVGNGTWGPAQVEGVLSH